MKIAIIAEHDNVQLKTATLNAIASSKSFEGERSLVLFGHGLDTVIEESQTLETIDNIIAIDHARLEKPVAEDITESLIQAIADFDIFICVANTFGKNFMPRLAAKLGVNAYSDIVKIDQDNVFVRPIYAGNVLQTVKALDDKIVLTVRPTAFSTVSKTDKRSLPVKQVEVNFGELLSKFDSSEMSQSERPELSDAKIVVSGGRGLQSEEKFKLIEQLADKLGAAVGASRAAVDAGFVANDYQVGQTGKIVAPELYIAIGISGAIQHLAGMKDSKIIVAINKDPEAPIFQLATYGLVGDLFEIIPELIEKL